MKPFCTILETPEGGEDGVEASVCSPLARGTMSASGECSVHGRSRTHGRVYVRAGCLVGHTCHRSEDVEGHVPQDFCVSFSCANSVREEKAARTPRRQERVVAGLLEWPPLEVGGLTPLLPGQQRPCGSGGG